MHLLNKLIKEIEIFMRNSMQNKKARVIKAVKEAGGNKDHANLLSNFLLESMIDYIKLMVYAFEKSGLFEDDFDEDISPRMLCAICKARLPEYVSANKIKPSQGDLIKDAMYDILKKKPEVIKKYYELFWEVNRNENETDAVFESLKRAFLKLMVTLFADDEEKNKVSENDIESDNGDPENE